MRSGWAPSIPFKKTSSVTERCVCVRQNCWRRDIAQTATTVSRLCRQGKWLDFRKHSNGSERTNVQPPWVIEGGQRWAGTVCRASSGVRWMFTFWKEERISVKCLRIKYSMWRGTLSGSRENKALLLCSHYLFKVLQTVCRIIGDLASLKHVLDATDSIDDSLSADYQTRFTECRRHCWCICCLPHVLSIYVYMCNFVNLILMINPSFEVLVSYGGY